MPPAIRCPKISFLAVVVAITVLIAGCEQPLNLINPSNSGGSLEQRNFYAYNFSTGNSYPVEAELKAENSQVLVYLEKGQNIPESILLSTANEFSSKILPALTSAYGTASDFDNNGQVILLLLDIRDGYRGRGSFIAGYFYPRDLYRGVPYSNEGEILYIDINPGLNLRSGSREEELQEFYSVIAHELQHLVHEGHHGYTELWINEGLSMAAEELYRGERLGSRTYYYFHGGSSLIASGNNFLTWDRNRLYRLFLRLSLFSLVTAPCRQYGNLQ